MASKPVSYQQAGVNIDEADRAVASIRTVARRTFTPAVLTDIGSFGGGYLLKGYRNPVLVSSADGVGTKLKLAFVTANLNSQSMVCACSAESHATKCSPKSTGSQA